MKTLKMLITDATDYLEKRGVKSARRQAEEIISLTLNIRRLELYTDYEKPVSEVELQQLRVNIKRRGDGEPSQYIRGEVEFLDCSIKVNPSVLIPRPETEILADTVIREISKQQHEGKILLDLCCGSGCIGISIKKKCPKLKVYLSDVSPEALDISKQNSNENHVDVICLQGDLFQAFGKQAHFIVCNPPYISEVSFLTLDREVREFEPKRALVGGKTGIEFYERLEMELPNHLYDFGKIWLEIGYDQGEDVKKIFEKSCWKNVKVAKDWSGHDRFFSCDYSRS